ncbi:MAG: SsrA-binding protein [Chlamydiales bacterium]|nr:SsrA-binding protein [Chlamydiales bacterium]MCH9636090.1 SsrA-binding protein [Chlamydiales bacterium]MCH9703153.1 SsrA-binding protein SmpB [Chlamydiota bacterium]
MKDLVQNRKGKFDFQISETFEAGIALLGTEIKSLRNNGGSLQEAYVKIIRSEIWLIGAHIAPYSHGNVHNHEERRDRKLLMHKKEIEKLESAIREKGMALVPLALYLKSGRVKLKFGLGKGKKHQDKRQTIIEREKKREMDRAIKKQD